MRIFQPAILVLPERIRSLVKILFLQHPGRLTNLQPENDKNWEDDFSLQNG